MYKSAIGQVIVCLFSIMRNNIGVALLVSGFTLLLVDVGILILTIIYAFYKREDFNPTTSYKLITRLFYLALVLIVGGQFITKR